MSAELSRTLPRRSLVTSLPSEPFPGLGLPSLEPELHLAVPPVPSSRTLVEPVRRA